MKEKILFACDLDNTLLISHRISRECDICAEILNGKEQSFFTPAACEFIKKVTENENIILLPVTTRSVEQYKRIKFPADCTPKYALTCNGAVLLKDGFPEENWHKESEQLTDLHRDELNRLYKEYSGKDCYKTVRIVDDMFLFIHFFDSESAAAEAEKCRGNTELTVDYFGSKMYYFPPVSNKGYGVKRFAERFNCDRIIAAGDSTIDCSMLDIADTALIPDERLAKILKNENISICDSEFFSEFILRFVLESV